MDVFWHIGAISFLDLDGVNGMPILLIFFIQVNWEEVALAQPKSWNDFSWCASIKTNAYLYMYCYMYVQLLKLIQNTNNNI